MIDSGCPSSIVDEHVESAVVLNGLFDQGASLVSITDVGLKVDRVARQFRSDPLASLDRRRLVDDHRGTKLGEPTGDLLADPAR